LTIFKQEYHFDKSKRVAVVLVNWNRGKDTIGCLRSILNLQNPEDDISVIIVDNDSSDDSISLLFQELLQDFRQSDLCSPTAQDVRILSKTWFSGGTGTSLDVCIVMVRSNIGFAAANNIGYQIARESTKCEFVWFLNNDTEVAPDSMGFLLRRMVENVEIGICGATLVFYDQPEIVQAYGGVKYSTITGKGRLIGSGTRLSPSVSNSEVESEMSYVAGASMFVRCSVIEKVGLMSEEYFLYSEEIDWAWRCRGVCRLGVEVAAIVRHKEGASIGTETRDRRASPLSEFFMCRSKLYFAAKHTPWFYPTVWLSLLARCVKLLLVQEFQGALVVLKVLAGLRKPPLKLFQSRLRPH
jgi:GT2 family glycosyltransferase